MEKRKPFYAKWLTDKERLRKISRSTSLKLSPSYVAIPSDIGPVTTSDFDGTKQQFLAASGKKGGVCIIDTFRQETELKPVKSSQKIKNRQVSVCRFFPQDDGMVATGTANGQVEIWDTRTLSIALSSSFQSIPINTISFRNSEPILCVGGETPEFSLYDVRMGVFVNTFSGHRQSITNLLWAGGSYPAMHKKRQCLTSLESIATENIIVSGSDDGSIRVWDLRTTRAISCFDAEDGREKSVQQSAQEIKKKLIMNHQTSTSPLRQSGAFPSTASFSAQKKSPIKASLLRNTAQSVIKTDNFAQNSVECAPSHEDGVKSLCLCHGGMDLLSLGKDGVLRMWNLFPIISSEKPQLRFTVKGLTTDPSYLSSSLSAVAFDSDGDDADDAAVQLQDMKLSTVGVYNTENKKITTQMAVLDSLDEAYIPCGFELKTVDLNKCHIYADKKKSNLSLSDVSNSQTGHFRPITTCSVSQTTGQLFTGALDGLINHDVYISRGLTSTDDDVTVTVGGILTQTAKHHLTLESSSKMYYPSLGDFVVGIITDRKGDEGYIVDINSYKNAFLPITAFEGATRRNQNLLKYGSAVFGRITYCDKHMEPTMSCISKTKGASPLGVLEEGTTFRCSTGLSKQLSADSNSVLPLIGKYIPFEIASGENGIVWILTNKVQDTITIWDLLQSTDGLSSKEANQIIENEIQSGGGFGAHATVFLVYFDAEGSQNEKIQIQEYAAKVAISDAFSSMIEREWIVSQHICKSKWIQEIIEFGKNEEKLSYLIQPLLGESLSDRVKRLGGRLTLISTLKIGIQMFLSLESFHQNGLVHCDIKPNNFLFSKEKDISEHLVLIDFGCSVENQNQSKCLSLPPLKEFPKHRYTSVSVHLGATPTQVDDYWSALFILIELSTGTLPWVHIKDMSVAGLAKRNSIPTDLLQSADEVFRSMCEHLVSFDASSSELSSSSSSSQSAEKNESSLGKMLLESMTQRLENLEKTPKDQIDWESEKAYNETLPKQKISIADYVLPHQSDLSASAWSSSSAHPPRHKSPPI
ncbi:putative exosome complex component RRP4 [Monocercomonoides exilis]|uniref:putative exosome complex component RRP4 n=1 Tax=Monocercomonoides exilis TaxID=2049356 RepID=UPI00355A8034|nr:putative exosome complex component RRP4 [Monocercomonoides exilis]|eukprot:MONOS_8516.1-p1 / transcript=MONOS_8516.1 / gene=MONOS_8516 / organism=Monocercomonoides_exilis_PA203 / gene_product=exosome complex component RRP4 / transcript_product=exosome complex component RRP4 / location=Mono_scaffold00323:22587-26713(+) / protein_length=1036 / sequence_SO=supercontig / SO=protein_coding / is_pseudo=false